MSQSSPQPQSDNVQVLDRILDELEATLDRNVDGNPTTSVAILRTGGLASSKRIDATASAIQSTMDDIQSGPPSDYRNLTVEPIDIDMGPNRYAIDRVDPLKTPPRPLPSSSDPPEPSLADRLLELLVESADALGIGDDIRSLAETILQAVGIDRAESTHSSPGRSVDESTVVGGCIYLAGHLLAASLQQSQVRGTLGLSARSLSHEYRELGRRVVEYVETETDRPDVPQEAIELDQALREYARLELRSWGKSDDD